MKQQSVLIYDTETDNIDPLKANIKYFGAYSYLDDKFYLLDGKKRHEIYQLIKRHKVLVGFNNKAYDNVIMAREGYDLKYKIIVDLWEISASRGSDGFGKNNKNRLMNMGFKLKSFTLKNIISVLGLDDDGNKDDIDYEILKKNQWTQEEIQEIERYLKQDIIITKKLFDWYNTQFQPLEQFLPQEEVLKFKHLTCSLASLSYQIICNKADLPVEWNDDKSKNKVTFQGGHHIDPRYEKERGNIVYIDFVSAYPHALMMGNLYSLEDGGWDGNDYFNLKGSYNDKVEGKIEVALKEVFNERLKAKRSGDKIKSQAYKIVINSLYGLTGNKIFKSIYNPITASDCTLIVRTWMKKLAKEVEENGFTCLYGFTDSIVVKIPDKYTEKDLMVIVDRFIYRIKAEMPFPTDTFGMDVEHRLKFIWFVGMKHNCYLWVENDDKVYYKSTLLNTNCPKVVMDVFNEYMKPKIVKELDINFSEHELLTQLKERLQKNPLLGAEEYKVYDKSQYKVKTSLHYQISEKYGSGRHFLIPNKKGIGIGRGKDTIRNRSVRRCSVEEFKQAILTIDDIYFTNLLSYLKPFMNKSNKTLKDYEAHIERRKKSISIDFDDRRKSK